MSARRRLFEAAGVVAALTVVSKVLGFVRETSLASVFGATHLTDAYLVGQTISGLALSVVGTALGTTFVPVYAKVRVERGRVGAQRMVNSVINAALLLALALAFLGEVLAAPLTSAIVPGFPSSLKALTVVLTRVMLPMMPFQAVSGLLTGMLQSEGNFTTPATAGLAFNTILISAILGPGRRWGIIAVAAGSVIATAVQAGVQYSAIRKMGFRWEPVLDWNDSGLLRIARLAIPVLVGTSVSQLGVMVNRMLASGLPEGSIAALNYAGRVQQLVPTILGTAIITVMYPQLARFAVEKKWELFGGAFAQAFEMISFIMIPLAIGMAVLRVQIVQLAFQRGAFGAEATKATAEALLYLSLGASVVSLQGLISRAFYAFQNTTASMAVGVLANFVNVALSFLLVGPMKQGGLALSTSIASLFSTGLMLYLLRRRISDFGGADVSRRGGRALLHSVWRTVVASLAMGGAVWLTLSQVRIQAPGDSFTARCARLFLPAMVGAIVYVVGSLALRIPAAQTILNLVGNTLNRWRRRRDWC